MKYIYIQNIKLQFSIQENKVSQDMGLLKTKGQSVQKLMGIKLNEEVQPNYSLKNIIPDQKGDILMIINYDLSTTERLLKQQIINL